MPNPILSSLILPVKDQTTGEVTNVEYDLPASGSSITVDDEISSTSTHPVQNKVISEALDEKANTEDLGTAASRDVPTSGNANVTQVVIGSDTRLTNARPASDVSDWAKADTKPTYTAAEVGAIPTTEKGANSGVAELDENGKVPSSQLPSYVDDVLEYESVDDLPLLGETGKIYVVLDTNKTYRWSGSAYVVISPSLALGETSSTAYRGDRGKTAYDHSQTTSGNPHNVTKSDVGLGNVGNFKAVSTVASQGLTDTEKSNARANIGAGTSSFSGSYNDLTNKPTIPTVNNATLTIQKNGTNVQTFTANQSSNATANITVPTKVSELTNDSGYTTNTGTVTQVKVGSTAYNPSSGVISLPAYPTDTNTHRPIQVNGTEVLGNNTTALNLKAGSNVTLTNSSGTVTIAATDTNTWRGIQNNLTSDSTTDSLSAAQGKALKGLVDGKAASSHTHNYAGSASAGGPANTVKGSYTGNGGQQGPSYFGKEKVGFIMSDATVAGDSHYKNWLYMDNYNGTDVGGATALGIDRTEPRAFIMQSDANRTSWNNTAALGVFTATPTSGQVIISDGTTGGIKSSGYTIAKSVPSNAVFTDNDTKNTAGSTDTSSKIFLIGATSQAANPQTYSHDTAYVGTDGCLYSGGSKVLTAHDGNNRRGFYGTCATAAATAAKVVTLSSTAGWELVAGTIVGIKFTNTNTAGTATLNVNSSGAKNIWYNGAKYTGTEARITGWAGHVIYYMYDGTYWCFFNNDQNYINTNTTYSAGSNITLSGTTFSLTKANVTGALGYTPPTSNTDTKNTAGSTDTSSKIFLIGATSQAANPQTYSHDTAYVGTDGCLYSGGTKVLTAHQDISGKAPTNHASTGTGYGAGTASNYGHVKLSDTYKSNVGAAANSIAASQTALYNAFTAHIVKRKLIEKSGIGTNGANQYFTVTSDLASALGVSSFTVVSLVLGGWDAGTATVVPSYDGANKVSVLVSGTCSGCSVSIWVFYM